MLSSCGRYVGAIAAVIGALIYFSERSGMSEITRNQKVVDKAVRAAKEAPPTIRMRVAIEDVPGLKLNLWPSGVSTWTVRYQVMAGGKRVYREPSLGDAAVVPLGMAIDRARELVAAVQVSGADPVAERKRADRQKPVTLDVLFEAWKEAKKELASWEMEVSRYERQLRKPLGAMPFDLIERSHVGKVRDAVARNSGGIESNRVVALFQRIVNFAVDEGLAKFNPAPRLRKVGEEKRCRMSCT